MYSDDEEIGFGGRAGRDCSRSRSPPRTKHQGEHDDRRGGSPRRGGAGREGGKDKGKGKREARTTGREMPKLNSIHKGTIARVQSFGAFVRLGDGSTYKDGLLHISRLSATGRVDKVEDVVAEKDIVWVKVVEIKEEEGKYSVDMRYVGQKDGEDKDPHNTQADVGGKGKGKNAPDPIRIGAVQDTVCTRCGARGHMAYECFAGAGKQYELLAENGDDSRSRRAGQENGCDRPDSLVPGHDPKIVKAALKAYMKKKALNEGSSSSSDSSKKKKEKKKEKKLKKKEKKKEKKEKKKLKKQMKKEAKANAKIGKSKDEKDGKDAQKDEEDSSSS